MLLFTMLGMLSKIMNWTKYKDSKINEINK
jgi:hypothetical protein